MANLFASGRIIDLILLLVACEALVLALWRARTGRGPPPVPLLCNLASGCALMLALRQALTEAPWPGVAACLAASFAAHGTELILRIRAAAAADAIAFAGDGLRGREAHSHDAETPLESVALPVGRQS